MFRSTDLSGKGHDFLGHSLYAGEHNFNNMDFMGVKRCRIYVDFKMKTYLRGKMHQWNLFQNYKDLKSQVYSKQLLHVHFVAKISLYFWNLQYVKFCILYNAHEINIVKYFLTPTVMSLPIKVTTVFPQFFMTNNIRISRDFFPTLTHPKFYEVLPHSLPTYCTNPDDFASLRNCSEK
jgi:hypothetical protein